MLRLKRKSHKEEEVDKDERRKDAALRLQVLDTRVRILEQLSGIRRNATTGDGSG